MQKFRINEWKAVPVVEDGERWYRLNCRAHRGAGYFVSVRDDKREENNRVKYTVTASFFFPPLFSLTRFFFFLRASFSSFFLSQSIQRGEPESINHRTTEKRRSKAET